MNVEDQALYVRLCQAVDKAGRHLELFVSDTPIRQSGIQCRALDRLAYVNPETGQRRAARVGRSLDLAAGELLAHLTAEPRSRGRR